MSSNLLVDDYDMAVEDQTPWRKAESWAVRESTTEKGRSPHVLQFPGGSISVTIPPEAEEPGWLLASLRALEGIGSLPENWNSYGGKAVTIHAIAAAIELLASVMSETTPLPAFVPTRRGGVQLEWHMRGIDLEIEILPSGSLHASFEDERGGEEWQQDVTSDRGPLSRGLATLASR